VEAETPSLMLNNWREDARLVSRSMEEEEEEEEEEEAGRGEEEEELVAIVLLARLLSPGRKKSSCTHGLERYFACK
jgi:hypothetical protein